MNKYKLITKIAVFLAMVMLLAASFALPCLPAQAADAEHEYWGLFVGVANYQHLNNLRFSDDDSRELYGVLKAIWGDSHTKLLLDSQAKKADILAAIDWLAEKAGPEDTVLFNFSGYGSYIGALHPYDSTGATSVNAITPDELAAAFESVEAGSIIFILNCGAAGTFQEALTGEGRIIIMSSAATENTYSITSLQNSVFIYYLMEAFSKFNAVDTNHDYELSVEEVFAYASPLTTQYEQQSGFPTVQHPVIDDGYSGDLPLIAKFIFTVDTKLPTGTTILTLDGVDYKSTFAPLFWISGGSHTMTVPQNVAVDAGTRYTFTGWNDEETSNTRVVSSGFFTASYHKEYYLTISSAYGSPTGDGWYQAGTVADFSVLSTVVAADSKHYFTGWSGDYTGTAANGSIEMNAPKAVTAGWRSEFLLTINSEYGEPVGAGWYDAGENANVSVEPVHGVIIRQFFTGWTGDLTATESNINVTMNSGISLTANWETDYLYLYLLIIGIVLILGGAVIVIMIYLHRRKKKSAKQPEAAPEGQPEKKQNNKPQKS